MLGCLFIVGLIRDVRLGGSDEFVKESGELIDLELVALLLRFLLNLFNCIWHLLVVTEFKSFKDLTEAL